MSDTTRTISCMLDDNISENIMKGKECLPEARKVKGLNPEKGAFGDKKAVERRYDKIRFCLSTSAIVRTFLVSLGFKTKLRYDPKSEERIKSVFSYIRREPHQVNQVGLNFHRPTPTTSQHFSRCLSLFLATLTSSKSSTALPRRRLKLCRQGYEILSTSTQQRQIVPELLLSTNPRERF